MICIDAENLRDGLYNVKDGKIFKYKAKGGTVRTYELRNIVRCGECIHRKDYECDRITLDGTRCGVTDDWFCADGEREGE